MALPLLLASPWKAELVVEVEQDCTLGQVPTQGVRRPLRPPKPSGPISSGGRRGERRKSSLTLRPSTKGIRSLRLPMPNSARFRQDVSRSALSAGAQPPRLCLIVDVAFEWEERKNFLHPRRSRWADKVTRSTFDRACDALKVSAEEKRVVALCLKQFKPEKKDL